MAWRAVLGAFENDAVVCDVLDALAVNLDGTQAAPGAPGMFRVTTGTTRLRVSKIAGHAGRVLPAEGRIFARVGEE